MQGFLFVSSITDSIYLILSLQAMNLDIFFLFFKFCIFIFYVFSLNKANYSRSYESRHVIFEEENLVKNAQNRERIICS